MYPWLKAGFITGPKVMSSNSLLLVGLANALETNCQCLLHLLSCCSMLPKTYSGIKQYDIVDGGWLPSWKK